MICGIYKITSPVGKIYIGQSKDIKTRWRDYKYNKSQIRLNRSFDKYGIKSHVFEILEECNIEDLYKRESYYQKKYDVLGENGLNCLIVDFNSKKYIFTEESRKKMSEGRMGIKNHRFGVKMSEEHKNIISKVHKGKTVSELSKEKKRITLGDKNKGGNNPRAKKVVCKQTGMIFDCITDCAEYLKMNRKTLNDQILGKHKNKTTFEFL